MQFPRRILSTHSQPLKVRAMASRPTRRMLLRKLRQSVPIPTQPKLTIPRQLRLIGCIQRVITCAALNLLPKRIVTVIDMDGFLVHGLACHQVLDHFPQVYLPPRISVRLENPGWFGLVTGGRGVTCCIPRSAARESLQVHKPPSPRRQESPPR